VPTFPDNFSVYETIHTFATYAPWKSDAHFGQIQKDIHGYTLVDIYRCWELWTLVEQSAKLEGDILEVGAWRGGTGALMAKKAALCDINATVYLCDTFSGVVKAGVNDPCYSGGEHGDTTRDIVEHLINGVVKLSNVEVLQGVFPEGTSAVLEKKNAKFRLCHIDVDVYQSAKDIVNWVWDRMVIGGVIVYDDYGFPQCQGITRFVNEQIPIKDRLVLYNVNGHALVVKIAGD
jgi:O-methyltransferase